MTLRVGQRVRVTYETTIDSVSGNRAGTVIVKHPVAEGSRCVVPLDGLEMIDDPTSDPIGTVRRLGIETYVRVAPGSGLAYRDLVWMGLSGHSNGHGNMKGSRVVGAVSGTPTSA